MSLTILPSLDSSEMASARQKELDIAHERARKLGMSAVDAIHRGYYLNDSGLRVDWRDAVEHARAMTVSIPPDTILPTSTNVAFADTVVQVSNETTLSAARRMADKGLKPVALNFANGIQPGGGFLGGARAQEEALCRSSALYATLIDDPMYESHARRPEPDSTDWAILSPDVPVFRSDDGTALDTFWRLDFITCAAPVATRIGKQKSAELLRARIHRVLGIASAYRYHTLVLGAWGCGAFGNDPMQTARDFRDALETEFAGSFNEIAFAITDWSSDRRYLGPFRDTFASQA